MARHDGKVGCSHSAMQFIHTQTRELPLIPKDLFIFKDSMQISYPKTNKANKKLRLRRGYLLATNVTKLFSGNQQDPERIQLSVDGLSRMKQVHLLTSDQIIQGNEKRRIREKIYYIGFLVQLSEKNNIHKFKSYL